MNCDVIEIIVWCWCAGVFGLLVLLAFVHAPGPEEKFLHKGVKHPEDSKRKTGKWKTEKETPAVINKERIKS